MLSTRGAFFFVQKSQGFRYTVERKEIEHMIKIALKGYARSGKDTVAEIIQDYLETNGHGYTRKLAFGDELRARFHDAFPEIAENPKPREGYEQFGKLGRELDQNIWVKAVAVEMSSWEELFQNFVISDLRQVNEADWCRENGFVIVEVWSPESLRKYRSGQDTKFIPVNESEERLHEIETDYKIFNLYDFDSLEEQVRLIVEAIIYEQTAFD
jgi:dephospho-CoA kinase